MLLIHDPTKFLIFKKVRLTFDNNKEEKVKEEEKKDEEEE